jgi:Fatty acid desaturase
VSTATCSEPLIPTLDSLGEDLLATSSRQRWLALARPLIGVAAYGLAAYARLWWLTPFLVFLIFVAVVTVTHDVVHGSLGLSRRKTDWALFAMGAVLLESGHAYRATHLRHYRVFPGHDDPEGDPARLTLIPRSAQPQPAGAFPPARRHAQTGRRPAPACALTVPFLIVEDTGQARLLVPRGHWSLPFSPGRNTGSSRSFVFHQPERDWQGLLTGRVEA